MWPDRIRNAGCRTNPRGIRKTSPAMVVNGSPAKGMYKKRGGGKISSFLLCLHPKRPSDTDASGACKCATWEWQTGTRWTGICLWCPACPTLCRQTLGKVVFKILEGEIREGEHPISALCTSTGLLCKMSVSPSPLPQTWSQHEARVCSQPACAHVPPGTALSSWMWL